MDGRCEGGPEEDGCHKLEDTCTQKRRLEDGREGGQGTTRTVEPWSSSSSSNNWHMGYVDKGDRMANSYSINRRTWKWTKKLFFHLLDLAILNSYILIFFTGG